MPITITLTREQAEALDWIADYGIQEKEYVLNSYLAIAYSANEQAEPRDTLNAASDALAALQGALRPAAA